jgi:hypothetical protein
MIELKEGMILPLTEARSGEGRRGPWFFVPARSDKGHDRITIWAANPQEAAALTGVAKIAKIRSVKLSARKGNDEKWYPDYSVEAVLVAGAQNAAEAEQMAFDMMTEVNDDELPFA